MVMLIAKGPRASESNHWYTRDGAPMYTVEGKDGKQRNTTLRDARKMALVPSVTTILNVMAKPGLVAWLQQQVLLAALTLPKRQDEPESEYISRIVSDSKEQGRAAADAGTDIHESIQRFYEGRPIDKHHRHVDSCAGVLAQKYGVQRWVCERAFAHELGFGGKVDMFCDGIVLDIKTKEFAPGDKIDAYDEHLMQLAAYRVGIGAPDSACANVFVSRSHPGEVRIHEWSQEDLKRGWEQFCCLLKFWQLKNSHS